MKEFGIARYSHNNDPQLDKPRLMGKAFPPPDAHLCQATARNETDQNKPGVSVRSLCVVKEVRLHEKSAQR